MTEEIKNKAIETLKNLPNLWKDFDAKNCNPKDLINSLNEIIELVELTDIKDDEDIKAAYERMCNAISETLGNIRTGYEYYALKWVDRIVSWLDDLLKLIFIKVFI